MHDKLGELTLTLKKKRWTKLSKLSAILPKAITASELQVIAS